MHSQRYNIWKRKGTKFGICVCVHSYAHIYACSTVHIFTVVCKGQRRTCCSSGIIQLFLRQSFSQAWTSKSNHGQLVSNPLNIHLSLPPQGWVIDHTTATSGSFHMNSEDRVRCSCLHGYHEEISFTEIVSPGLPQRFQRKRHKTWNYFYLYGRLSFKIYNNLVCLFILLSNDPFSEQYISNIYCIGNTVVGMRHTVVN